MRPLRALVIDDDCSARLSAECVLSKAGYEVEVVADAKLAWASIERAVPDVVLVDGGLPGCGAIDLVRRIRGLRSKTYPYVVVEIDRHGADITSAFAMGADDVIRRPYGRDELVARVDGAKRIRRVAARLGAGSGIFDWSEGTTITNLEVWSHVEELVCDDLEVMLGTRPRVETGGDLESTKVGAWIPLSLPSDNLEVRLCVGFDEASLARVARTLMGEDASNDARRDVARELVSTTAAVFRRESQKEGVLFTVGLPADVAPAKFSSPSARAVRKFQIAFEGGAFASVRIEVIDRTPEVVPIADVRDGMVLARDVLTPAGALLLTAGTRLSPMAIHRIVQILGARYQVEVASVAA